MLNFNVTLSGTDEDGNRLGNDNGIPYAEAVPSPPTEDEKRRREEEEEAEGERQRQRVALVDRHVHAAACGAFHTICISTGARVSTDLLKALDDRLLQGLGVALHGTAVGRGNGGGGYFDEEHTGVGGGTRLDDFPQFQVRTD